MKRILINATHAEEIRVALCNGNHVYDFDLENRTREQKKSNIYKGHVTRVEPSLEAVFVEYGSERQGFLSIREIAKEYLSGDPRNCNNIRDIITEGTELLVQVEKEERGNKGAALSTYISLAGRYLVLMPNNASGGGISRQISGSVRDEMKRMLGKLKLPKGMSVIIRTAGIGRTQDDLQNDLNHLLDIWKNINHTAQNTPSPCLTHREAGVVTRAVRDYLREDIAEVWIDNEQAYNEAYHFVQAVMPHQLNKLRKYLDFEPLFSNFGIENQIETAYQREVKLPSGGSIVIDQTEALVSIDINSAKSTKGGDVESTAFHTNIEAADEIARQLRLRDMGGLVVIDFIDMLEEPHRKEVENRIKDATQYDRARIQFAQISRFGLLEMSRQRLRPSLEESTGYVCPRCHGNGMIRDLRSLSLSIMRNIEKIALKEGRGEVQVEVPIEIGAFLLNEKRDALVYLEQDSGARITILPHAHLETPAYKINFNQGGFAPSSYERVTNTHDEQTRALGYETNWQTQDNVKPKNNRNKHQKNNTKNNQKTNKNQQPVQKNEVNHQRVSQNDSSRPEVCAWLSNLFTAPTQAQTSDAVSGADAAAAIESYVNNGGRSKGVNGNVSFNNDHESHKNANAVKDRKKPRKNKNTNTKENNKDDKRRTDNQKEGLPKRSPDSKRSSRGERNRNKTLESPEATDVNTKKTTPRKKQQPSSDQVVVNVQKTQDQKVANEFTNIDIETGEVSQVSTKKQTSEVNTNQVNTNEVNKKSSAEPQNNSVADVANVNDIAKVSYFDERVPFKGRAKNDPRNFGKEVDVKGTVAQFITAQLGENSQQMIAEKGLVATFIVALAGTNKTEEKRAVLSEDIKVAHRNAISAVDSNNEPAGTSSKQAPTAEYRASNDPRGRISGFESVPEHLQVVTQEKQSVDTIVADANTTNESKPESDGDMVVSKSAPSNANALRGLSVKQLIESVFAEQAQQLLTENSLETLFLKALSSKPVLETSVVAKENSSPTVDKSEPESDLVAPQMTDEITAKAKTQDSAQDVKQAKLDSTNIEDKPASAEDGQVKTATKKPRAKSTKPVVSDASEADSTEEKPKKPRKASTTRQRRTSKKVTADKVTIEKKPKAEEKIPEKTDDTTESDSE